MDWDDPELPAPKELTEAEIAFRGRRMTALRRKKTAVKALIQPQKGSFTWPQDNSQWAGAVATIDRFQDEWCYVSLTLPTGETKIKNFGYTRILKILEDINKR